MEEEGMESQTGFRYYRGTIDGAFTVINALRKRQEHNLESYVAFIDLIKAFDSVPRAALWKVLLKFGFPRHFVRVVMRLHTGAVMKFKINDQAEDADVASSGPSCEGAAEQPSPPTPTPTSPLSTSGNPAQLSATRRKLQRHGRICRTQKFRRLTRGANPIFRPDAPLSIATMDRGAYRICGQ